MDDSRCVRLWMQTSDGYWIHYDVEVGSGYSILSRFGKCYASRNDIGWADWNGRCRYEVGIRPHSECNGRRRWGLVPVLCDEENHALPCSCTNRLKCSAYNGDLPT